MWYERYLKSDDLVLLNLIKLKVKPLLDSPAHRHFSDHTTAHSDRIVNIIGDFLKGQNNLDAEELFILLAAAYLHDLGTQIKKSDLLGFPRLDDLLSQSGVTRADLETENKLLTFVREWHHYLTHYMITDLLRSYLGLDDCRYTEEIALVAQGHRKVDLSSNNYAKKRAVRLDLLAAFLRLADELDCDKDRIDMRKMRVLDLSQEDKLFWFGHYCIDRVDIKKHYIKIYGKAPAGFKKEFELLYVAPLWKKYMEVLEILRMEGYVLAWARSEFLESHDMLRVFEAEEGLLEYIKTKAEDIEDVLDVPGHLSLYEESGEETDEYLEVSPFYFTSLETFNGIRIRKWPERACCCKILIVDDPLKLRGTSIPAADAMWESPVIKKGEGFADWPALTADKEYGYVIIFSDSPDAEFVYLVWKGIFSLLSERNKLLLSQLSGYVRDDRALSDDEKQFLLGSYSASLGANEDALKMLFALVEEDSSSQLEAAVLAVSICKKIEDSMEAMEWFDESARIQERISRLLLDIAHMAPMPDKEELPEGERLEASRQFESAQSNSFEPSRKDKSLSTQDSCAANEGSKGNDSGVPNSLHVKIQEVFRKNIRKENIPVPFVRQQGTSGNSMGHECKINSNQKFTCDTSIKLSAEERRIIQYLFSAFAIIHVYPFTSGLGGAKLFRVEVKDGFKTLRPFIAKIGDIWDIREEKDGAMLAERELQSYCARVDGDICESNGLAGIKYTIAGFHPTTFRDLCKQHDESLVLKVLNSLFNRFSTLDFMKGNFQYRDFYSELLPADFTVIQGQAGKKLCPSNEIRDAQKKDYISLDECLVLSIRKGKIKVREKTYKYIIDYETENIPADIRKGITISIAGIVTDTRDDRLRRITNDIAKDMSVTDRQSIAHLPAPLACLEKRLAEKYRISSFVHGDLNANNIITDKDNDYVPWLIDFAKTRTDGHAAFDYIELELDLKRFVLSETITVPELLLIEDSLATYEWGDLSAGKVVTLRSEEKADSGLKNWLRDILLGKHKEVVAPTREVAEKAFRIIAKIRDMASLRSISREEYMNGLFLYSLATLKFEKAPYEAKLFSYASAAYACSSTAQIGSKKKDPYRKLGKLSLAVMCLIMFGGLGTYIYNYFHPPIRFTMSIDDRSDRKPKQYRIPEDNIVESVLEPGVDTIGITLSDFSEPKSELILDWRCDVGPCKFDDVNPADITCTLRKKGGDTIRLTVKMGDKRAREYAIKVKKLEQ